MKRILVMLAVMLLAVSAGAQTNMALPAGTSFKVKLENTLSTFSSKEGDAFSGRVVDAVMLDGKTVIPVGATVQGRVTKVNEPRRIAGKPTIGILPEDGGPAQRRTLHAQRVHGGYESAQRNRCEYRRPVQGRRHGWKGPDRNRHGHGRRYADRRSGQARQGPADRWRGRRYAHGCALAGQEAFGGSALRNRVDDGIEPSARDDGRHQRPIARSAREAVSPVPKAAKRRKRAAPGISPG